MTYEDFKCKKELKRRRKKKTALKHLSKGHAVK